MWHATMRADDSGMVGDGWGRTWHMATQADSDELVGGGLLGMFSSIGVCIRSFIVVPRTAMVVYSTHPSKITTPSPAL